MRPLLTGLLILLSLGVLAPTASAAPQEEDTSWRGRNAFDVWKEEHRWVRVGMRFYGLAPQEHENARLETGAGFAVPITTDFFMGIGMKVGFLGGWTPGRCEHWGVDVSQPEDDSSLICGDNAQYGVDYTYRQPISALNIANPGADANATRGSSLLPDQRRDSHVANFALNLGINYELTIPNVKFFRIFQPFLGGGAVIAWVITYSDMREGDFVLINNDDNDTTDSGNLDPWALTEAVVGGEFYGGFHLNMDKVFRFTFEFGYYRVDVPSLPLTGASEGWDAVNLDYTIANGRFGGGFEFRF
jgi:hypothetical protein